MDSEIAIRMPNIHLCRSMGITGFYTSVSQGQQVERGTPIGGFFGTDEIKVISPVTGIVSFSASPTHNPNEEELMVRVRTSESCANHRDLGNAVFYNLSLAWRTRLEQLRKDISDGKRDFLAAMFIIPLIFGFWGFVLKFFVPKLAIAVLIVGGIGWIGALYTIHKQRQAADRRLSSYQGRQQLETAIRSAVSWS